ncbi:hypothetical protein M433DRAFT_504668 [Acidomyces richmondensis BFW]|nr:MAG: hypothetical protein FE78DRAFT_29398 [Acidomyces sp. 'richmondensis']KYG41083.1 hypothetical protein M433DRAFT_504668 [Acidomyces richmondensis BFW]
MKVTRASWLKSQKAREGKTHSSLILSVQSAQQVRDLVRKGPVHNGTLLIAEEFQPQQRATQCLNCGLFSHNVNRGEAAQTVKLRIEIAKTFYKRLFLHAAVI